MALRYNGADASPTRASAPPRTSRAGPLFVLCGGYFSCDEMLLNVVFRLVPRPFTTAMITTAMPAAISPYSIAVAPHSSLRKCRKRLLIHSSDSF